MPIGGDTSSRFHSRVEVEPRPGICDLRNVGIRILPDFEEMLVGSPRSITLAFTLVSLAEVACQRTIGKAELKQWAADSRYWMINDPHFFLV